MLMIGYRFLILLSLITCITFLLKWDTMLGSAQSKLSNQEFHDVKAIYNL